MAVDDNRFSSALAARAAAVAKRLYSVGRDQREGSARAAGPSDTRLAWSATGPFDTVGYQSGRMVDIRELEKLR
jgi:hypothetical protein